MGIIYFCIRKQMEKKLAIILLTSITKPLSDQLHLRTPILIDTPIRNYIPPLKLNRATDRLLTRQPASEAVVAPDDRQIGVPRIDTVLLGPLAYASGADFPAEKHVAICILIAIANQDETEIVLCLLTADSERGGGTINEEVCCGPCFGEEDRIGKNVRWREGVRMLVFRTCLPF